MLPVYNTQHTQHTACNFVFLMLDHTPNTQHPTPNTNTLCHERVHILLKYLLRNVLSYLIHTLCNSDA